MVPAGGTTDGSTTLSTDGLGATRKSCRRSESLHPRRLPALLIAFLACFAVLAIPSSAAAADTAPPDITITSPTTRIASCCTRARPPSSTAPTRSPIPPASPRASRHPINDEDLGPHFFEVTATDRGRQRLDQEGRLHDRPARLRRPDRRATARSPTTASTRRLGSSEMLDSSGNHHDGDLPKRCRPAPRRRHLLRAPPAPAARLRARPPGPRTRPPSSAPVTTTATSTGSPPRPAAYTMEAWVKPRDGADMMVMGHGGGGQLFISGGKLAFRQVQDTITLERRRPARRVVPRRRHLGRPQHPPLRQRPPGRPLTHANKPPSGTSTFYVGYGEMAPWFHGDIDEAAYYDHALTGHDFDDRYKVGSAYDIPRWCPATAPSTPRARPPTPSRAEEHRRLRARQGPRRRLRLPRSRRHRRPRLLRHRLLHGDRRAGRRSDARSGRKRRPAAAGRSATHEFDRHRHRQGRQRLRPHRTPTRSSRSPTCSATTTRSPTTASATAPAADGRLVRQPPRRRIQERSGLGPDRDLRRRRQGPRLLRRRRLRLRQRDRRTDLPGDARGLGQAARQPRLDQHRVLRLVDAPRLVAAERLEPGGAATVSGGRLTVDGASAGTNATYGSGRTLDFKATFNATPFAHAGFGTDYNNPPWAMFSVKGDGRLYARTNNGARDNLETDLGTGYFGADHRYRIEWTATKVVYYVDGNVAATHAISFGPTQMRPLVSDFNTGGGNLSLDWLRMSPHTAAISRSSATAATATPARSTSRTATSASATWTPRSSPRSRSSSVSGSRSSAPGTASTSASTSTASSPATGRADQAALLDQHLLRRLRRDGALVQRLDRRGRLLRHGAADRPRLPALPRRSAARRQGRSGLARRLADQRPRLRPTPSTRPTRPIPRTPTDPTDPTDPDGSDRSDRSHDPGRPRAIPADPTDPGDAARHHSDERLPRHRQGRQARRHRLLLLRQGQGLRRQGLGGAGARQGPLLARLQELQRRRRRQGQPPLQALQEAAPGRQGRQLSPTPR